MSINNLDSFKTEFKKVLESAFIPSNANQSVISTEWNKIYDIILPNIPEKLFRYRRIDEEGYSKESLRDGTIFLCHAGMFPDKYDSYLYVDRNKIQKDLKEALTGALHMLMNNIKNNPIMIKPESVAQVLSYFKQGYTEEQVIDIILTEQYSGYINEVETRLKKSESRFRTPENSAKIACFTESVQSKYMWDRYADGYKGFALEYDFRKCIFKYNAISLNVNIFPIIYSDLRLDVTNEESRIYAREACKKMGCGNEQISLFDTIFPVDQLYWYKSYLYKDKKEYEHEREWRMIYYNLDDKEDYTIIPDCGCLRAIYYGPDIDRKEKEELHKIAKQKGIKEYNVNLNIDSRKYDLKISPVKNHI